MKQKKPKIVEKYNGGYLVEVRNPRGTKAPVYIYEGHRKGFMAGYINTHRVLPGSSMNAEVYARKLAKRGHKRVEFR